MPLILAAFLALPAPYAALLTVAAAYVVTTVYFARRDQQ